MKLVNRMMMAGAALALAGCSVLPGARFFDTFTAESYLSQPIGGEDFDSALSREYQALANRSATRDVHWMDATAYVNKSKAAAGGGVGPWTPAELGLADDGEYQTVLSTIETNKAARPAECAKLQAMWDAYLESQTLRSGTCLSTDEARAALDEALAACGVSDLIVYFNFGSAALTAAGHEVVHQAIEILRGFSNPTVSLVGHTDTVASVEFNQRLSEQRAATVERSMLSHCRARGVNCGTITTAGRSENDLAVQTGDNVREQLNRRVTIAISE
ncbi:MAG: OmpA family protein [Pseudomonadota bacterium]